MMDAKPLSDDILFAANAGRQKFVMRTTLTTANLDSWAGRAFALESRVAELEKVREVAEALSRQMALMNADPKYQGVWTLYAIHGGLYDGIRCADELEALAAALRSADKGQDKA
jgi:hypothetical protein